MARYLFEMELAPQAFAAYIKAPGDRGEANRVVIESVGGKQVGFYFAVGSSTVYSIIDNLNEVSASALMIAVMAGGAVTSIKTVAILTSAEAVEAMKMAGGAGYRPPAG